MSEHRPVGGTEWLQVRKWNVKQMRLSHENNDKVKAQYTLPGTVYIKEQLNSNTM